MVCQIRKSFNDINIILIPGIDECMSSPCRNNATCTDMVDGYNCTCSDGFMGELCEISNLKTLFGNFRLTESSTRPGARRHALCHVFPIPSMNRLNQTSSAIF